MFIKAGKNIGMLMILILGSALFLAATAIAEEGTSKTLINDKNITRAVMNDLRAAADIPAHMVDVVTQDSIVTLSGSTSNILARERAVEVASSIVGVQSIINNIEVKPVERTDTEIKDNINNALSNNPVIEPLDIGISVTDGVVTMTGSVSSRQEKKFAEKLIKGVEGVRDLSNQITVNYQTDRPDMEVLHDIQGRLKYDVFVDEGMLNVEVDGGKVTLSGTVGSAVEWRNAYSDAWVAGVNNVNAGDLKIDWSEEDEMRRQQAYGHVPDSSVEMAVRRVLKYDPRVDESNIEIDADSGLVALSGIVKSLEAKNAAGEDALNTFGVWGIRDYLNVRPDDVPENDVLEARVEEAILWDPYLEDHEIDISVENGLVKLHGNVDNSYEYKRAGEIVSRLNGVVDVKNKLEYEYTWERKSDQQIRRDVREQLFWSPYINVDDITVAVNNGIVRLTGEVDNQMQWSDAEKNAFEGGAKDVINELIVKRGVTSEEIGAKE